MRLYFNALLASLFSGLVLSPLAAHAEPAMWTLSDEDTVINIIGTVHYLPEDADWRSVRINSAFETADTVCFEVDADSRLDESINLMSSLGVFQNGDRLVNHLTKDQEKDLRETAEFFGIPFASLNVMKPWLASLTIEDFLVNRLEFGDGVEFTLYPEVLDSGKEICEMETPAEQLTEWATLDVAKQVEIMFLENEETKDLSIAEEITHSQEELENLIAEWLEGDVRALDEIIDEEAEASEAFHDALLVNRNARWVPRIEDLLAREGGNIFIAVGAAHLAGEDSVITMLREKGYQIEGP